MAWWMAVAGVQMAQQMYQGQEQKQAARVLAARQGDAYMLGAKEELRRLEIAQRQNISQTDANIAASGLLRTGSVDRYKTVMEREQERQYDMQKLTMRKNFESIRLGGQEQGRALQRSANAQAFSTGLGFVSSYWQNKGGG